MDGKAPLSLAWLLVLALGCASLGGGGEPDWVMNPDSEGGLVDTQCVPAGPPLSVLKSQAIALARAELGRQLSSRITVLDKSRQEVRSSGESQVSNQSYSATSEQFVEQAISGARPARVEYVELRGEEHLCAMVRLGPDQTRRLYEQIRNASGDSLGPDDDAALWREFQAERSQNRLEGSGGR